MSVFAEGAYKFYLFLKKECDKKRRIFEQYGFDVDGLKIIAPREWELMGAILMRDKAKLGNGADLMNHEIKSARIGNSFEYQYHKNSGLDKLQEDRSVDHIFFSYGKGYERIEVRRLLSTQLCETFDNWVIDVKESYHSENPKQRCRHNVSYGYVNQNGELLMLIEDGKLIIAKGEQ